VRDYVVTVMKFQDHDLGFTLKFNRIQVRKMRIMGQHCVVLQGITSVEKIYLVFF